MVFEFIKILYLKKYVFIKINLMCICSNKLLHVRSVIHLSNNSFSKLVNDDDDINENLG